MWRISGGSARLLERALTLSLADPDDEQAVRTRRQIIDAAYKVDEKFAERLADRVDDDPARIRAKEELKSRFRVKATLK